MDLSLFIQVALVSSVRDLTMLNQIFADLNIHHPIISNNDLFNHSDTSSVSSFIENPWTARTFLFKEKPLSGSALPCGNKRTQRLSLAIVLYFKFPSQSLIWDI